MGRAPRRKGKLAALTVATGHAAMTKPDKVAWQRDLYTLRKDGGALDLDVEAFMAIIEEHAADPIKRLAALPESISDEDRWTIGFFLALQQGRTPPGLADHRRLAEAAAKQFLRERREQYDDLDAVAAIYRRAINPGADEREIRAFADAQKRAMPDPDGHVQTTPEAAFQSLFLNVSQITLTVVQLSGRGDDRAPAPGHGVFEVAVADADEVKTINLRTYGWADQLAFGTTTRILRGVHEAARAAPESVPAPISPKIHEPAGSAC